MPYAINKYTADGSTTTFSVSFPYLSQGDLVVSVDGVVKTLTTDYTIPSSSQVTFNTAPTSGLIVEFRRNTSQSARLVDYTAGAIFKESDLDTDGLQTFYMSQEAIDIANDGGITLNSANKFDADGTVLTNLADPIGDTDAVTKGFLGTNLAAIEAVAGISSQVVGVASISPQIINVNANAANINTVAGDITNVNSVGADIANVNAVAGDAADIGTVAGISSDVTSVATNANNVTAVASNSSNINAVAGNATNINSAVSNASNINAVVGNSSNINTVAGAATDINTVSTNMANINNVNTNMANVSTVAASINDVNSFAEKYNVSATAPTGTNTEGDLWYDSTANVLKVWVDDPLMGAAPYGGWQHASSAVGSTSSSRLIYTVGTNHLNYTSGSQSVFPVTYDSGYIDVFLNGVKLVNGVDFTATNGTSVGLTSNAAIGDKIEFVAYGNQILTDVSTVSPYISEINTVSSNMSDINTVVSNLSTIGTVATNIADISAFASNFKFIVSQDVLEYSHWSNVNAEWTLNLAQSGTGGTAGNASSYLQLSPFVGIQKQITGLTAGNTYAVYFGRYSGNQTILKIGTTQGAQDILYNNTTGTNWYTFEAPSNGTIWFEIKNPYMSTLYFDKTMIFDVTIPTGYNVVAASFSGDPLLATDSDGRQNYTITTRSDGVKHISPLQYSSSPTYIGTGLTFNNKGLAMYIYLEKSS